MTICGIEALTVLTFPNINHAREFFARDRIMSVYIGKVLLDKQPTEKQLAGSSADLKRLIAAGKGEQEAKM